MDDQIKLITEPITRAELKTIAAERYGDMVKAVVDLDKKLMAVGAEMHADEEVFLIDRGSEQQNLWGINLYPDNQGEAFLEFDSMINLRPKHGNRTRGVDSAETQNKIKKLVTVLVRDV